MSDRVVRALADRAAAVLRRVFGAVPGAFAFRLWDGTIVGLGSGPPAFTIVIHSPDTFLALMRDPTPLAFGEAYIESAIDIEGDRFAAMHAAAELEEIHVPMAQRLRLLLSLGPVALVPRRLVNGRAARTRS